jgi:plastocyanin
MRRSICALAMAGALFTFPLHAVSPVHPVDIQNFAFMPDRLDVHVGEVIEWTNKDFAPHTVTDDCGTSDSGLLKYLGKFRFSATTPGVFAYHCSSHPAMKGVIVVTAE